MVTYADMHKYLTPEEMEELEIALGSPNLEVLGKPLPEHKHKKPSQWLFWFFDWESSPQGHNYWRNIKTRLEAAGE